MSEAVKIAPLSSPEKQFNRNHPEQIPYELLLNNFTQTELMYTKISVPIGIKGIDKSKISQWKSDYVGEPIMDNNFDVNLPES